MQTINRITLVLRAKQGETLAQLLPHIHLGALVAVGTGVAVIAGASDRDVLADPDEGYVNQTAENVNLQQSAPQSIPGIIPANWTDKQVLEFCSVALRHVVVSGDLHFSDINDALRHMADKGEPAFVRAFDIDEHVTLAQDARRYRWMRDVAFDTPRQDLALRDRHGNMLIEGELDAEIDQASRAYPGDGVQEDWSGPSPETLRALGSVASRHPMPSAEPVDPRDLFIKANPMGASDYELTKGRRGFVDDRTHGDWLIFKAGFEAAQEAEPCAS